MRQNHRAGEDFFVDYDGSTVPIVNPDTGEIVDKVQVFVAVMDAFNYTFAEQSCSIRKDRSNRVVHRLKDILITKSSGESAVIDAFMLV